ncbi:NADAR family protein [Streptomyces sp. NBC_01408]|uniref:NADAR family protein n=1 Tax=Streptomyces sp. NBC_01408 TaxID=2903855 RepID=UPI00224F8D27|nr:NADAR family protein [Streptomyces sp. NBC_01408]MCX4696347.1 NADAR family protein [Streptomyces sp. NBC_01408]
MTWHGPTFRISDGENIDGAWRLVWRKHDWLDEQYPEHLFVYADGRISLDRFEATDLAGLGRWLASGKIALHRDRPDAPEPSPGPPKWEQRYPEPCTDESFLAEVADEIARLAGRPRAADRCWDAIRAYQAEPTEVRRAALRDAYLAVPAHLRVYMLGDMERQDRPLRILVTALGERVDGDGPEVTERMHQDSLDYFARADAAVAAARDHEAALHADDPTGTPQPPVVLTQTMYPGGWPDRLGDFALRNDYEAPFSHRGETYPTVVHGYWALSAADHADHDLIRAAATADEARELGGRAVRRADWPAVRLAVMAGLLRAKFDQHPELAELLLGTGQAGILYTGFHDSPYWRDEGPRGGRNWTGRLLELIRSELAVR